jgi:hypothetical protein
MAGQTSDFPLHSTAPAYQRQQTTGDQQLFHGRQLHRGGQVDIRIQQDNALGAYFRLDPFNAGGCGLGFHPDTAENLDGGAFLDPAQVRHAFPFPGGYVKPGLIKRL